jgi:hypothetical protein
MPRSRFLLATIGEAYPTPILRDAYFENLRALLRGRPRRPQPGRVVIAPGTGRCGSTTLAAAVAAIPNSCATHENPPLIYWEPEEEQVQFHMDRLRILADYCSVVFDASHWWLNVVPRFLSEFPQGAVVGLHRELQACVTSFLHIKGTDVGSLNHWVTPGNNIWVTNLWDPTYPSYALNGTAMMNPAAAKAALIERYVDEYNRTLLGLRERYPQNVELIRTEALNDPQVLNRLSEIVGHPLAMPARCLNVKSTIDSDKQLYQF